MIENSSAANTFSMSRCAMMLPIVARRSPATTTPPGKVAATIVVPCGLRSPIPGTAARDVGKTSGATRETKSVKDEDPIRKNSEVSSTTCLPSFTGHPSERTNVRTLQRSLRARRLSRPTTSPPRSPVRPCAPYQQGPAPRPHDPQLASTYVGSALTQPYLLLVCTGVQPNQPHRQHHDIPSAAVWRRGSTSRGLPRLLRVCMGCKLCRPHASYVNVACCRRRAAARSYATNDASDPRRQTAPSPNCTHRSAGQPAPECLVTDPAMAAAAAQDAPVRRRSPNPKTPQLPMIRTSP